MNPHTANTLPLHIELLYNDYNAVGAFAAATTLTVLALITLAIKTLIEAKGGGDPHRPRH